MGIAATAMKIDFLPPLQTISWLCWVPKLLVADVLANASRKRLPA